MAIGYGMAVPKGKTLKQLRAKAKRDDSKAMRAFQDECWRRAMNEAGFERNYARCAGCHLIVYRERNPLGHVHHRLSRRHKATRHDPNNGVILCRRCHNDAHRREF